MQDPVGETAAARRGHFAAPAAPQLILEYAKIRDTDFLDAFNATISLVFRLSGVSSIPYVRLSLFHNLQFDIYSFTIEYVIFIHYLSNCILKITLLNIAGSLLDDLV